MRKWLKRAAYVLGTLVVLVFAALAVVYGVSEARFRKNYPVPPEPITVADDSATLARGQHLATAIAKCVGCHGSRLEGQVMFDAAPMGRLVALNLTSGDGGVGNQLTPADIERAVRHGLAPTGRPLLIMPSNEFQYLSDDDMRAIVSYVKHAAPVNNVLAPSKVMMLPRVLMVVAGMHLLPAETIAEASGKPMAVAPGPTPEYGEYLAWVSGCKGCHGPNLSGGKIVAGDPAWPPAANITMSGNIGRWTEQQFIQTLRTGARPEGSKLNEAMPWQLLGKMTDDELHAVWSYLRSVPARAFGNH